MLLLQRAGPRRRLALLLPPLLLLAAAAAAAAATPGFLSYADFAGRGPFAVTYDNRSLILGGRRSLFASVGVHYPRLSPGQWDDALLKAKNDGYNMVQTYFFANVHMPKASVWPWRADGSADLRRFIGKAAAQGLFVDLRIGPYICAEWSWGGYPYDIAQVANMTTRSSNPQWEAFMSAIFLNATREFRDLFADRGGPIVLAQVENELRTDDQAYIDFCGALAQRSGVGVPFLMCNGNSSASTINSCNGADCTAFLESHGQSGRVLVDQPALWTELWMGWFSGWGDKSPAGAWPAFDATNQSAARAASILRWAARGGSLVNMYNFVGGNHFARNSGGSYTNAYYWDAPLASDGLDQGPERRHMARTFAALAAAAAALLASPAQLHGQVPVPFSNASGSFPAGDAAHVAFFYPPPPAAPDIAFIENNASGAADMVVAGRTFRVAGGASLLVRASDGSVLANSSDVEATGLTHGWSPVAAAAASRDSAFSVPWTAWADTLVPASAAAVLPPTPPRQAWVGSALGAVVHSALPLEAVAFSEYDSEIVLYETQLTAAALAAAVAASPSAAAVTLSLASSAAQAWSCFADGRLVGTAADISHGNSVRTINVTLNLSGAAAAVAAAKPSAGERAAAITLALVSSSLGIGNGGGVQAGVSTGVKGVTSASARAVVLGGVDITAAAPWVHVAGSVGELKQVFTAAGGATVPWAPLAPPAAAAPPLTWLRTTFTAPAATLAPPVGVEVTAVLNLDATGLSRGRFFVNGMDLGRYWSAECGEQGCMCQRYYSIPPDLLLPGAGANFLVVLDELGPTNVSAVSLAISSLVPAFPAPPLPCGGAASAAATMKRNEGNPARRAK